MTNVVQDASFLRRALAFIIDLAIIDVVLTAPFTSLFAGAVTRAERLGVTGFAYTTRELAMILTVFLILYGYFVLFEYLLDQTPGMMITNTMVRGEQGTSGGIVSFLVRNCFLIPIFPFILFWVIEPFAIIFWRRSVLEHLTKTRTVYERSIIL